MRKSTLITILVLTGIVAPILACSDNSGKPDMSVLEMSHIVPVACTDIETPRLVTPWSDDKMMSDNDISKGATE